MEKEQNSDIQLPPGFRFHPSDEELIVHYLKNKIVSSPLPANIITEIDLYKYDPWELPGKASFGEDEWFFFTPRDRKYPNGTRPNRAAGSGYWKATGTDKHILTSYGTKSIGVKKALVFYAGRPPKGVKTDWIMNEYRLLDTMFWTSNRKGSMRLDDWVLCRIRHKSNNPRNTWKELNSAATYEPADYFQQVDQSCSKSTNPNLEMVKDYFYKDCPMLPYIFASQEHPNCMETTSSISFQSIDNVKSCSTSIHEYFKVSNKKINDQFSVLASENMINDPFKRKHAYRENNYQSNLPTVANKKMMITNVSDCVKPNLSAVNNQDHSSTMNCWSVEQFETSDTFNISNPQWTSSNLQFQELGHLD
ncbi:hypothetical protein FNV43_RR16770 [Rhamnella rubrinervis]|uniref:NAC domain-containing protein n=1 Tax=Rhamnella rubrinervis TaxID=2594499 RepID=A0A8K0MDN4_9ROSA|nr:hypothetical protein FNV43_RR16770 [Rhamnella rubrinervis]